MKMPVFEIKWKYILSKITESSKFKLLFSQNDALSKCSKNLLSQQNYNQKLYVYYNFIDWESCILQSTVQYNKYYSYPRKWPGLFMMSRK